MNEKQKREAFQKCVAKRFPNDPSEVRVEDLPVSWGYWQDGYEHGRKASSMPPDDVELPKVSCYCCSAPRTNDQIFWHRTTLTWCCEKCTCESNRVISFSDWLKRNEETK